MFVFTEGATIYGGNSNEEITAYYDNIISCSKDVSVDIEPILEPFPMVQNILSYVTKSQKGMSSIMEKACNEAFVNHMTLKESV